MVKKYIISHLSSTFFSIFIPIFTIASVIFLVKISAYTTVIVLSADEMFKLYLFSLPQLLFYTLPIAFVVGVAITLYKLSQDNELLVIFSLGKSPLELIKIIFIPAFLLSALLLFNFYYVTPYIKSLSSNFLAHKNSEAKFNISASEFGHNFGDWMLFVNKSDGVTYQDIVLFNKELKNAMIIKAENAHLRDDNKLLTLELNSGTSYSKDENELKIIEFNRALIHDRLSKNEDDFISIDHYWSNPSKTDSRREMLIFKIVISLFPVISIFILFAMGIVHSRHQKRWIYLWIFTYIILFYISVNIIQDIKSMYIIPIASIVWLLIGYIFYHRLVGRRF